MNTSSPSLTPTVIAAGGISVEVINAAGAPQSVFVRLLKLAQLPLYLQKVDDDLALAALVTDLPPAELDAMPAESVLALVATGHDLNFNAACRWAERRASLIEASSKLSPGVKRATSTPGSATSQPSSP